MGEIMILLIFLTGMGIIYPAGMFIYWWLCLKGKISLADFWKEV